MYSTSIKNIGHGRKVKTSYRIFFRTRPSAHRILPQKIQKSSKSFLICDKMCQKMKKNPIKRLISVRENARFTKRRLRSPRGFHSLQTEHFFYSNLEVYGRRAEQKNQKNKQRPRHDAPQPRLRDVRVEGGASAHSPTPKMKGDEQICTFAKS